MKEEIIRTLGNTLKHDKTAIKEATARISELRKQPGFYLNLMAIADDQQQSADIRQASLASFKVAVERRWMPSLRHKVDALIDEGEKNEIRKSLLEAMVRCNLPNRFLPLWRAIVKHIMTMDYTSWKPTQEILAAFEVGVNIPSVLHFLLAIVDALEIPFDKRPQHLQVFIVELFPVLYDLMKAVKTPEVIFLVTKIVWKGFHMELAEGSAKESFRWIPILLEIIQFHDPSLADKWEEVQKNTPEFFYFHSKKWAIRLLYRYIQRHANYKYKNQNEPFSKLFYSTFGKAIPETLLAQLSVPTIKKAKYFLFKGLQALADTRAELIDHQAPLLLYTKLPPFLTLTPEDERLAKEDPMELLKAEMDPVQMYTNTKRAAVDLWISLNEIGSTSQLLKEYIPGKYLYRSMEYLRERLNSGNLLEVEMAMYILCQLASILRKVEQVKSLMPNLIEKYVIPEFANAEMFLRARAVEMFTQYGFIKFPDLAVLQRAVEGIYKCLAQDPQPIVSIKAACAFNSILSHKEAIEMVRPHLQQVLTVYIQLLEKYELEEIVESLEGIVTHFADNIGPYAVQLATHITRIFGKCCRQESSTQQKPSGSGNYDEEGEIAAMACLSTLSKIVNSPIPTEAVGKMEELIIPVVSFAFISEGIDYFEDALDLLASYLYKVETITPQIWFFYPVIFYYLFGVDKKQLDFDKVPEINPLQKKIFDNLGKHHLHELHNAVPSIRLFIFKGRSIVMEATDFFGSKLLTLLFRLADAIYKAYVVSPFRDPDEFDEIQCEQATTTALFAHLLECFKDNAEIVGLVWNVVRINLQDRQEKQGFVTLINLQLVAMCLYSAPEVTLQKMEAEGVVNQILSLLVKYQRKYLDEWHKQRMLFGLSGLLRTCPKPVSVIPFLPKVFRLARDLTKDICNMRKDEAPRNMSETETEEGSGEDADDNWDELHMINYDSCISNLDEVEYFEESLRVMQQQETALFTEMLATLRTEQLQQLNQYIEQAKKDFKRLQREHGV